MTDLKDGETTEIQGSGKKPYVLKNVGGVYSCSCPAWRNQSNSIDVRTCKHIIKLRGEDAERARLGDSFPEKGKKSAKKKTAATVAKQAAAEANKPSLLLAHSWDGEMDPTGWWMSEKLDGVRAYWDGENFISRLGNIYHAPDWFKEGMPHLLELDGELFVGRGEFQRTVSIVRRQDKSEDWKEVKYRVFDAPRIDFPFEKRMAWLQMRAEKWPEHVEVLPQMLCLGEDHLQDYLTKVEGLGGEGVMLRQPGSPYVEGRSTTLLKVKSFQDSDAVVVGYKGGKGRHKGRLGALECRDADGIEFDVGSGFSDQQRENPPEIGCTITYKHQGHTNAGKPRFPIFLRERTDV